MQEFPKKSLIFKNVKKVLQGVEAETYKIKKNEKKVEIRPKKGFISFLSEQQKTS